SRDWSSDVCSSDLSTIGIYTEHHFLVTVVTSNMPQNSALVFKINSANLHFDALKTGRKLLLNLSKHVLFSIHPYEPVDRNPFVACYKIPIEIHSLASIFHIEQCHLYTEFKRRQFGGYQFHYPFHWYFIIEGALHLLAVVMGNCQKIWAIVYAQSF